MTHSMLDAQPLETTRQTGAEQPQRAHTGPLLIAGDTARADEERDYVGEDSIHSFPASDAPGWISMWAGTPMTNADHCEEVV
jgi:hypothetical protein